MRRWRRCCRRSTSAGSRSSRAAARVQDARRAGAVGVASTTLAVGDVQDRDGAHRTPVVQTGKEGKNLGELVITLDGGKLAVGSYRLYPIDDTIAGDPAIARMRTIVPAAG